MVESYQSAPRRPRTESAKVIDGLRTVNQMNYEDVTNLWKYFALDGMLEDVIAKGTVTRHHHSITK
jgi:hypothetical protein